MFIFSAGSIVAAWAGVNGIAFFRAFSGLMLFPAIERLQYKIVLFLPAGWYTYFFGKRE